MQLNCDLGEGIGNDAELMPYIDEANIACGFHAGDAFTMRETVALCIRHKVKIGAHPSYLDRENFGRKEIELSPEEIYLLVRKQVETLKKITEQAGAKLHHVKPHGALYNMAAKDPELAKAIGTAIRNVDGSLILYGLSESVMLSEGKKLGLRIAHEVFADRTYQEDGTLTPRANPTALIKNEVDAKSQVLTFIQKQKVRTVSGNYIDIKADTICLHGDGIHAVAFAQLIYTSLRQENIFVKTIPCLAIYVSIFMSC
jgi:UPF0271 protein